MNTSGLIRQAIGRGASHLILAQDNAAPEIRKIEGRRLVSGPMGRADDIGERYGVHGSAISLLEVEFSGDSLDAVRAINVRPCSHHHAEPVRNGGGIDLDDKAGRGFSCA